VSSRWYEMKVNKSLGGVVRRGGLSGTATDGYGAYSSGSF
jgi:hypothetical protein